MRFLLLLLALCLLAVPAGAESFNATKSCSNRDGACLNFDSTDGTDDSLLFRLSKTMHLFFDPDTAVSTVPGDGAQIFLRRSMAPCTGTASDNTSSRVLVNQDGSGGVDNVAMDGTNDNNAQRWAIYNVTPGCYFIERAVAAASGDSAQVSFEEVEND